MTWFEIGKTIAQLLIGAGVSAVIALFLVSAQKKKLLSESGKTDAEADLVLTDAFTRRAAAETSLLEPYERIQARMQREIDNLGSEVERLRNYIDTLCQVIRDQGVAVPPMPPKHPLPAEPAPRNGPPVRRRRR